MPSSSCKALMSSRISRLDCHVECGRGLIRNEQLGPARQRHGDHHALAHSAGKAVRILVHPLARGRDAHPLQDAHGLCLRRATRRATVVDKSLRDLEPDREHRIEARHRLLEDHGDAVASDLAHLLFRQIEQALTLERDSALNAAVHRRYQLHDGQRGDALARARLAHDGHCLARPDLEATLSTTVRHSRSTLNEVERPETDRTGPCVIGTRPHP